MAKYVIEIEDARYVNGSSYKEDILYRAKGFKSLVFDKNGLDKLTPYAEPDDQEIREKVEQEVWEFASMLMTIHPDIVESIYWSMDGGKGVGVAADMTYSEAKAKYEAWKKKKSERPPFKPGQEWVTNFGIKCTLIDINDVDIWALTENGCVEIVNGRDLMQFTGRVFPEIAELIKKMRED